MDSIAKLAMQWKRGLGVNLPGGKVERLEAPWKAAQREVLEEVGLVVRVDHLKGVCSLPEQETVAFVFLCIRTGGTVRLSEEADDIQYFKMGDLPPKYGASTR